jgi:hypothetical protein
MPLKVNGVWYLDAMPMNMLIELESGELKLARITPFRDITEHDLTIYNGYHPRKCKGQPLPDYLYRHYGLIKNEETMSETLRTRVKPSEKKAFMDIAGGKTESEFLRDLILEKIREGNK